MEKGNDFENILDDCLDRLIHGESIESCLALYPEHAAELGPLLKTAQEAHLISALKPSAEFRQRAGIEFQKAIAEMPQKQPRTGFRWQLKWVIPVAVFLVLFSSGAATVVAATNSLPGSPLYGLKLAAEQVQMAFTFSSEAKAELYARFVDYRVAEIVSLAEEGDLEQVEQATEHMNSQLLAMADLNIGGINQYETKDVFALGESSAGLQAPVTTVPATSATPSPTPTTSPPATENEVTVLAAPPVPGRNIATSEATGELSPVEKLKQTLTEKYQQNLQILLEQLEKAPQALKPAIQTAIEVLKQGYEQAIASLG